jgi:hypothetical protein
MQAITTGQSTSKATKYCIEKRFLRTVNGKSCWQQAIGYYNAGYVSTKKEEKNEKKRRKKKERKRKKREREMPERTRSLLRRFHAPR